MNKTFKKKYIIDDGLIKFQINNQKVKDVVDFYTKEPFPNYSEDDDKFSINQKGELNDLSRTFKNLIGFNKDVLEVGSGTGQFSIYLSIGTNNRIYALDPTLASINLGKEFALKNKIKNIRFVNADIFDDVFKDSFFDYIWTNGVLHHTENPRLAFNITQKYLKKDGYIMLGLYNKYGRARTIIRKYLYKVFGKSIIMILDPILRNIKKNHNRQIMSWIQDQYEHPLESLHTLDEVLIWFDENNIEFINSIPSCNLEKDNNNKLFDKTSRGTIFTRILSQIFMIFNHLGSDGGLFVVIGKKR